MPGIGKRPFEQFIVVKGESDMPAKRSRLNKFQRNNGMRSRQSRVPRPLRTRGTPDGYYEIPVTIYRRLYFNMSTGLWVTDPVTAATSGSTGYNGFGLGTQLDTSTMYLGGSGASVNVTVPGFAELQNVFDECKIARIHYEFWFANQSGEGGTTLLQAPNVWIVQDTNSVDPPSSQSTLLQYANVKLVKGDIHTPTKITLYPRMREDVSSDGAALSTSTTSSVMDHARYCSTEKPSAFHFGLRGWFETNAALATVYLGYLCIKETQIRRYKRCK